MDIKAFMRERFILAIKKTFPHPTPLIGEKWFVHDPPPASKVHFLFAGIAKLAKATGIPYKKIEQHILVNLDLRPLEVEALITPEHKVSVRFLRPPTGLEKIQPTVPGASTAPAATPGRPLEMKKGARKEGFQAKGKLAPKGKGKFPPKGGAKGKGPGKEPQEKRPPA